MCEHTLPDITVGIIITHVYFMPMCTAHVLCIHDGKLLVGKKQGKEKGRRGRRNLDFDGEGMYSYHIPHIYDVFRHM